MIKVGTVRTMVARAWGETSPYNLSPRQLGALQGKVSGVYGTASQVIAIRKTIDDAFEEVHDRVFCAVFPKFEHSVKAIHHLSELAFGSRHQVTAILQANINFDAKFEIDRGELLSRIRDIAVTILDHTKFESDQRLNKQRAFVKAAEHEHYYGNNSVWGAF